MSHTRFVTLAWGGMCGHQATGKKYCLWQNTVHGCTLMCFVCVLYRRLLPHGQYCLRTVFFSRSKTDKSERIASSSGRN